MTTEPGIVIVGAGPVGMTLALALKDAGLDIVLVDARPRGAARKDPRILALSHGTRLTLERLGIWTRLPATPIETIHVSHQGGLGRTVLQASEYGQPALGYVADATYPMYYFREQLAPYHPSREDWTKPGDLRIVELPNFADLSMTSTDAYGRDMDQWPLFRTQSAAAMLEHLDRFIAYAESKNIEPFLCFYFHPWEFHPMPQGEIRSSEGSVRPDPFITLNCGDYAVEQLDLLVQGLQARGAEFLEAREAAARC